MTAYNDRDAVPVHITNNDKGNPLLLLLFGAMFLMGKHDTRKAQRQTAVRAAANDARKAKKAQNKADLEAWKAERRERYGD